ncbi:MAG TPA: TrwH protein [Anaeromyxobacteraceae bacterium]|nr:TrwH protein [Anaeromyxobacteraceae bacterium]
MRRLVLVIVSLAAGSPFACATAPKPKEPDESYRMPVNRVVPPELGGGEKRGASEPSKGLLWR